MLFCWDLGSQISVDAAEAATSTDKPFFAIDPEIDFDSNSLRFCEWIIINRLLSQFFTIIIVQVV